MSSQKQQQRGFSLESQEDSIRQFADEHDYDLSTVHSDVISTAEPDPDRSGFYSVISQITSNQVDAVLVRGTSRLGRNMPDKVMLSSKAETYGVDIVGVDGEVTYDMSNPMDEFRYHIESALDRLRNRERAQLVHQARQARAENGYWPQGKSPTGYTTIDDGQGKVLVPDDDAWYVLQVYRYYLEVGSYAKLREWANELPWDVPTGASVFGKILTNKAYAGYIPWQGDWYPGRHEGIVSPALWNAVWRERNKGGGRPTSDDPIPT